MISFILASVIAVAPQPSYDVLLYDDARNCTVGVYAEKIVQYKVVDTGCWYYMQTHPMFMVKWNSLQHAKLYQKGGVIRMTFAANYKWPILFSSATLLSLIQEEDTTISP